MGCCVKAVDTVKHWEERREEGGGRRRAGCVTCVSEGGGMFHQVNCNIYIALMSGQILLNCNTDKI